MGRRVERAACDDRHARRCGDRRPGGRVDRRCGRRRSGCRNDGRQLLQLLHDPVQPADGRRTAVGSHLDLALRTRQRPAGAACTGDRPRLCHDVHDHHRRHLQHAAARHPATPRNDGRVVERGAARRGASVPARRPVRLRTSTVPGMGRDRHLARLPPRLGRLHHAARAARDQSVDGRRPLVSVPVPRPELGDERRPPGRRGVRRRDSAGHRRGHGGRRRGRASPGPRGGRHPCLARRGRGCRRARSGQGR
jgi:hypothetical protein